MLCSLRLFFQKPINLKHKKVQVYLDFSAMVLRNYWHQRRHQRGEERASDWMALLCYGSVYFYIPHSYKIALKGCHSRDIKRRIESIINQAPSPFFLFLISHKKSAIAFLISWGVGL